MQKFKEGGGGADLGRGIPDRVLGFIALVLLLLLLVNGALPQLQLALLGTVIIPSIILKFALLLLLAVALVTRTRIKMPIWIPILTMILICYLGLSVLRIAYTTSLPSGYLLFGINAYYSFLLALPLAFGLRRSLSAEKVLLWLWCLSIPLVVLGTAQWWTRMPLLPTESPDRSFFVGSWQFLGGVRAFSLFNSSFEFGQFIMLIIATSLAALFSRKRPVLALVVLLVGLVGAFTTLTRNIYIGVGCVIFTVLLIRTLRNWRLLLPLPVVYAAVAFWLAGSSEILGSRGGIADTGSLSVRFSQWKLYLTDVWRGGISQLLFGTGYVQNDRYSQSRDVLIDNTYLAVTTHIGLVGLLLIITGLIMIWVYSLRLAVSRRDALSVGVAGVLSASLAMGVFNIVLVTPTLLIILLVISSKERSKFKEPNRHRLLAFPRIRWVSRG